MRDEFVVHEAKRFAFIPHPSSLIQSVSKPAKVMFAHERLEDFCPGQKTEAFAQMRAAAKAIELRIAGQRAQLQLFNAEKGTQLRMLAVKNRAGLAHRVLSPGERVDAHAVIVPS